MIACVDTIVCRRRLAVCGRGIYEARGQRHLAVGVACEMWGRESATTRIQLWTVGGRLSNWVLPCVCVPLRRSIATVWETPLRCPPLVCWAGVNPPATTGDALLGRGAPTLWRRARLPAGMVAAPAVRGPAACGRHTGRAAASVDRARMVFACRDPRVGVACVCAPVSRVVGVGRLCVCVCVCVAWCAGSPPPHPPICVSAL